MTSNDVKRLAAMGEGRTLEFKNRVPRPERIAREVIALANTDGGTVLVGVDDDGTVLGGQQNAYLASLVWTPTDNTRFMLNYGRIEFDDAAYVGPFGSTSYSGDVFGLRGQVDF